MFINDSRSCQQSAKACPILCNGAEEISEEHTGVIFKQYVLTVDCGGHTLEKWSAKIYREHLQPSARGEIRMYLPRKSAEHRWVFFPLSKSIYFNKHTEMK